MSSLSISGKVSNITNFFFCEIRLSVFSSHIDYFFRSVFPIIFDKSKQNTLSFVCSRENALLVSFNMGHPNRQFIRVISRQREITQGHSYSSIPTEEMQKKKILNSLHGPLFLVRHTKESFKFYRGISA